MGRSVSNPPLFYKGEYMDLMNLTLADLMTMRLTGYDHDNAVCDYIRETIRTFDPMFDVAIDNDTAEIVIFHNGTVFQRTPCEEFDRDTIQQIGRVAWKNIYGDILSEIDAHNEQIEKARKQEYDYAMSQISKDIAKYSADIRR